MDECVKGVGRLVESDFVGPLNIGSDEMVSINRLAEMVAQISGKTLAFRHVASPEGVRGRNSENRLICQKLGWVPSRPLREGLEKTYEWIEAQVEASRRSPRGDGVPETRSEFDVAAR